MNPSFSIKKRERPPKKYMAKSKDNADESMAMAIKQLLIQHQQPFPPTHYC